MHAADAASATRTAEAPEVGAASVTDLVGIAQTLPTECIETAAAATLGVPAADAGILGF